MSKLLDFLQKNSIGNPEFDLPYVHSTRSHNLEKILENGRLETELCDVFHEELLYFFRGRPAYREESDGEQASYWQLPTCFVYERLSPTAIARTFPFDSGAFEQGRYPKYIGQMSRDEFELTNVDGSGRILEAFFGDIKAYVEGKPKSEDDIREVYDITAFDAEVMALHRLASDGTPKNFDDRRFSIEVQLREGIELDRNPPSAVILPVIYYKEDKIRQKLSEWNATPITYDVHAQSLQLYYGVIFQKFREYCRDVGLKI